MRSGSRFAERACAAFWARVARAASVPAPSLGVFRWLYGLYFLGLEAPSFTFIDLAPRAFFDPPVLSPAFLLDAFPAPPFFRVLDLLAVAALGLMTVGYRTRTATLSLFVLRLVGASFHYSFGKIDHDILALAILPCMWLADWGRHYSLDARSRQDEVVGTARGTALFAVLLAFGMLTAGLPKAMVWIDFDLETSGILSWYYPQLATLDRQRLLAPYVGALPALLREGGDYLGPLLELSAFAALLHSRRAWLGWLLLASVFHLINVLLLNINFISYAVLYCCFANLEALGPFVRRWLPGFIAAAAIMASWHLLTRALWVGGPVVFAAGPAESEVAGLWSSLPVFAFVVVLLGSNLAAKRAV